MLNLLEPFEDSPEILIERLKTPKTSDEFYLVALAFELLGKNPKAEQMFRLALQNNIQHVPSLYGLSLKAFQSGKETDGKTYFRRAVRFDALAEGHVLRFQKELKAAIPFYQSACSLRLWVLQELERLGKSGLDSQFEIAKLLFEQSKFAAAVPYFRLLLKEKKYTREAAEYLSFALENLYHGDELLNQALEILPEVENRADLFFNLAMVCHHEQRRLDLALHFFFLASNEEPDDPGLKFSLEQAALEVIGDGKLKDADRLLMMFAHLYQGSVGVAKKYASDWDPQAFSERASKTMPSKLWNDWLLKDQGAVGRLLRSWSGRKEIC